MVLEEARLRLGEEVESMVEARRTERARRLATLRRWRRENEALVDPIDLPGTDSEDLEVAGEEPAVEAIGLRTRRFRSERPEVGSVQGRRSPRQRQQR